MRCAEAAGGGGGRGGQGARPVREQRAAGGPCAGTAPGQVVGFELNSYCVFCTSPYGHVPPATVHRVATHPPEPFPGTGPGKLKTGPLLQDLEARKRAPLYQKKQEEEMRAVAEKAAEADIRAQEAEIKFKEAKVLLPPSRGQPP